MSSRHEPLTTEAGKMTKLALAMLASLAVAALYGISVATNSIAQEMKLANCIEMAKLGVTCAAARDPETPPDDGGTLPSLPSPPEEADQTL